MAFQVLLALVDADRHGYGIIREVDQRTAGRVRLRTGSLYTLLQRLLEAELVEPIMPPASGEGQGDGYRDEGRRDDSRRRYYRLAPLGREVLRAEARRLESLLSDAQRKHVLGGESKVWP
jgi:DNA-binding PadR family transcriptional regulator